MVRWKIQGLNSVNSSEEATEEELVIEGRPGPVSSLEREVSPSCLESDIYTESSKKSEDSDLGSKPGPSKRIGKRNSKPVQRLNYSHKESKKLRNK